MQCGIIFESEFRAQISGVRHSGQQYAAELHYEDISELDDDIRQQRISDLHGQAQQYYFRWTDYPLWRVVCQDIR